MAEKTYFYGKGKRKTAVAKVRLYEKGKGELKVNDRKGDEYINTDELLHTVFEPLKVTGNVKSFDISVLVRGGGPVSQAEAIRHGISKALLEFKSDYRTTLKKLGFLTRDPRMKERKKYGRRKARRSPQWSKR